MIFVIVSGVRVDLYEVYLNAKEEIGVLDTDVLSEGWNVVDFCTKD